MSLVETFLKEAGGISRPYMIISRSNRFIEFMKEKSKGEQTERLATYWGMVASSYHKGKKTIKGVLKELKPQEEFILDNYNVTIDEILEFLSAQKH